MIERVLWLNGTVGSGKSTIGALVAERLASRGVPTAFVSTDWLGDLGPRSPEDPFNATLVVDNLAAVAENFSAAGARDLVVAGVIKDQAELERFTHAVGATITLVRLVVPAAELEERLRGRHGELDPTGLRWHLDRAPVLTAILDAAALEMIEVSNSGNPADTAAAVVAAAGWA
ncbi:MAG TPA: AAA family ATPase [Acidimicrobiales bacterium]|nr:AAA family ATPase [Acidimicrobiales bacterium]